jgi:radical SAM protein with 4Fe4S-binding SPASM domain
MNIFPFRSRAVRMYARHIKERFSNDMPPLPRIIHLETRSRCNSLCSFCLANARDDPRKDQLMSDALVEKIFKDLAAFDYPNRLSLYNNNEPTLDKRLPSIIESARTYLPRAYLEVKTNGKGLNSEKVLELFNSGLDTLYINDYTEDGVQSLNIEKIRRDLSGNRRFLGHFDGTNHLFSNRLIIFNRQVNQVLGSRGGTAPNKAPPTNPSQRQCFRPFEMMTISPSGDVGVCSEDLLISSKMGNLQEETIATIWNSEKYKHYRSELILGRRSNLTPCSKCDYAGHSNESLNEAKITSRRSLHKTHIGSFLFNLVVVRNKG